ncbi:helix-turn-helix domain-containing protein [Marispirochaeta sp.]|uniref:helix-turn-helix domain-containing protein n=1 Tax=Marispirochaeta sp. TaxID=2038653 RepID=UPI0029C8B041|nr:helix-turn-helix domain-containing protein [Marispirochaeta sp.]
MVSLRVFTRFLATYILLISLPLITGTLLVQALVEEYERKVTESQITLLDQGRAGIESLMNDVEWQAYQISGNAKLLRFLSSSGKGDGLDNFLMREIVSDFNSYLLYSNMITSTFYVYCPDQETIFTPYSIYHTGDFVDGKTFFHMREIRTADWHEMVFARYHLGTVLPSRPVTIEDFKNKSMIPYLQSIPLGYLQSSEDVEAAVIFLIGEDEISRHLESLGLPREGYAYMVDEDNRVLTATGREKEDVPYRELPDMPHTGAFWSEDASQLVVYTASPLIGWRYIAVLPTRWAFRAVSALQRTTFLGLLGSLVISMGMALILAYRRSESLGHIFSQIREVLEPESRTSLDYKSIDLGVSRLIEQNSSMQQELNRQREQVFANFLNRLLNGYYRNPASLNQFGALLGLGDDGRHFTVLSIGFNCDIDLESPDMIDQLNKVKVVVKTEFQSAYRGKVWFYDPAEERIAAICVSPPRMPQQDLSGIVSDLCRTAARLLPAGISVGIGSSVENLVDIHRSYAEAREAEFYCRSTGEPGVHRFEEIERSLDNYHYPIEVEVRLLNSAAAGDASVVTQIFDTLIRENFELRGLPDEKIRFLLFEMRSTLAKLVSQLKLQASDYRVQDKDTNLEDVEELRRIFLEICRSVETRKKSHNFRLISAILEYLKKNYTDRNLSLASVAAAFSITESYLSFFFKEQTGEKFSACIERKRIEAAAELLKNSEASVLEIAKAAGYNSDKTFRRVFRRTKGASPSEYREEQRQRRVI